MFPMWILQSIAWMVIILGSLLSVYVLLFLIIHLAAACLNQLGMISEFKTFVVWRKEQLTKKNKQNEGGVEKIK